MLLGRTGALAGRFSRLSRRFGVDFDLAGVTSSSSSVSSVALAVLFLLLFLPPLVLVLGFFVGVATDDFRLDPLDVTLALSSSSARSPVNRFPAVLRRDERTGFGGGSSLSVFFLDFARSLRAASASALSNVKATGRHEAC